MKTMPSVEDHSEWLKGRNNQLNSMFTKMQQSYRDSLHDVHFKLNIGFLQKNKPMKPELEPLAKMWFNSSKLTFIITTFLTFV